VVVETADALPDEAPPRLEQRLRQLEDEVESLRAELAALRAQLEA
jgi:prefoldin subunit 5